MKNDLIYAFRHLRRRPGFTLFVTLTLAVGIGASTTIFSLAQAVVLKPLPFPRADRLVTVLSTTDGNRRPVSFLDFEDFRRQLSSFAQLEAFEDSRSLPLTGDGNPERVRVSFVTEGFFDLLGVQPAVGRLFGAEDAMAPHVVIAHSLWQRRLGGSPQVQGSTLRLADLPYTVIGVLPADFVEFSPDADTEVFLPLRTAADLFSPGYLEQRDYHWLKLLGRLSEGTTTSAAEHEARGLAAVLEQRHPKSNAGIGARVDSLRDYAFDFRDLGTTLWVLTGAVVLLLGIACVNVGNLLLVRGLERHRELAMRRALGASGRQLLRQLLAESLLLALIGGVLGALLSFGSTRVLVASSPLPLPPFVEVSVDPGVLAACLLLSLLVGLVVGLVPALRALRMVSPFETLRSGMRTIEGAAGFGQRLLIIVQVTMALLPLVGAALLLRSFLIFTGTGYGFDTQNLLTARVQLPSERYSEGDSIRAFHERLLAAGHELPGVRQAHLWGPGRAGGSYWTKSVLPEGRSADDTGSRCLFYEHRVTETALQDLGIHLLGGRSFEARDRVDGELAALVSRSLAETCWPGEDPIGKRFKRGTQEDLPWLTVIGIVEDARHRGRGLDAVAHDAYYLLRQIPTTHVTLMLQTEVEPMSLVAPLRTALVRTDPDIPLFDIATLETLRDEEANETRFYALLMGAYAASALLLVSLGIFSVLSYVVEQRSRELSIREALGARPRDLIGLVGSQMAKLLGVGLAVGVVIALVGTRIMQAMLYGVDALDPTTFVLAPLLLLGVGLLACAAPLRRVARTNPVAALKGE